jgi:hypothetical protein
MQYKYRTFGNIGTKGVWEAMEAHGVGSTSVARVIFEGPATGEQSNGTFPRW